MIKNYVSPIRGQKEDKRPSFYCRSCSFCTNNRCSFYNRHVQPDVNSCFNHSYYSPVSKTFKAPTNLIEIMEREQKNVG